MDLSKDHIITRRHHEFRNDNNSRLTSNMEQPTLLRPAGFNERRCIARDVLGLYGSIVTVATYTPTDPQALAAPTPNSAILKSIKRCITLHPVLSTVILHAETESPQLARVPRLNLGSHVEWSPALPEGANEKDLGAWLEKIHDQPLPSPAEGREPRWRVHLRLEQRALRVAFAASHALCDGRSTMFFHRTFLESLRDSESLLGGFDDSNEFLVAPPGDDGFLQPLELAAPLTISLPFLIPKLATHFLPGFISRALGWGKDKSSKIWTGAESRPGVELPTKLVSTGVHLAFVPEKVLTSVLRVCRERRTRLTALLNILAAKALGSALESRGKKCDKLLVDTAIDLRGCLPDGKGRMANYVSVVEDVIPVRDGNAVDWDAAVRSTENLKAKASTLKDQPVALLRYLTGYREYTVEKNGAAADGSFSTSNLGVFEEPEGDIGNWKVESVFFSQSADGTGSPFNLNFASCRGGALGMVLSWWPGMFGFEDERAFAADVCDNIVKSLAEIAKS